MLGHRLLSAAEYRGIWRRRRKWALGAFALGCAAGALLARVLPARFVSTALVGLADSPRTVPHHSLSEFTAPHLAALKQQALADAAMLSLAAKTANSASQAAAGIEVAARLEKSFALAPAPAGFTVSCVAAEAGTAQQFCGAAASLLAQLESKNMQRDAAAHPPADNPVTGYLAEQVLEARKNLDQREATAAEYRRQHAGELAGDERTAAESKIAADEARLQAEGAALKSAIDRRAALTETLFTQTPALPQERPPAESSAGDALEQELAADQARLVTLQTRYTPDHPDVVKLKAEIARLQKRIDDARKTGGATTAANPNQAAATENPQFAQVQAQIRDLDLLIQEKTREQARLQEEILTRRANLQSGSLADQEFRQLATESERARSLYTGLLAKQAEAQRATQLESLQAADSLRVVEAASFPVWPEFPNPLWFSLSGGATGLVAGLLVIIALEMRDKALRTESDVTYFLDLPTLAVIPPVDVEAFAGAGRGSNPPGKHRVAPGKKEDSVLADA